MLMDGPFPFETFSNRRFDIELDIIHVLKTIRLHNQLLNIIVKARNVPLFPYKVLTINGQ